MKCNMKLCNMKLLDVMKCNAVKSNMKLCNMKLCNMKLRDVMLAAHLDSLAGGGVDDRVTLAHGATVDAHVGQLTKSALLKLEG